MAGRDLHYVGGMCCYENIAKRTKEGQQEEGSFDLQRVIREEADEPVESGFCIYPEERLGRSINSAGIMWEIIEKLFQIIRIVISKSGITRSGTFNLMWPNALLQFWEVRNSIILALKENVAYNPNYKPNPYSRA